MNTPASRQGNFVRYTVYLISYLLVAGVRSLTIRATDVRLWGIILFASVSLMTLIFYVYRFNREQRFFSRSFVLPWLGNIGLTIGLTLIVVLARLLISYEQAKGVLPQYGYQVAYAKYESVRLFWFLIAAQGFVLPILQSYLSVGFFFNYWFRRSTRLSAVLGLIGSGVIFSLLSFQPNMVLLLVNFLWGVLLAWSYLYTQTLWMPIYLSILNGVLMVILA